MNAFASLVGFVLRLAGVAVVPPWVMPAILITLAASGLGGAYLKGRIDAAANCHEAALRTQVANLERDIAAQKAADETEAAAMAALEDERSRMEREISDYETELASRPAGGSCTLTPSDIDRLRRIGG